tara:strand:+ start:340 stop:660 length:321 start_codon:yes stop_codon:yes gene_type:complete
MNEEIKKKLERLEELEKQERAREKWKPYNDMKKELGQMYRHQDTLETAAHYQGEVEDITAEYGIHFRGSEVSGSCMWNAYDELTKQIQAKVNEFEELHWRLTEREE